MTHQEFIERTAKYVAKYAPNFGIKVYSPIIAQACLESGYGTSNKVVTTIKDKVEWRHNYFGLQWRNNRCSISNDYFEEITTEQNSNGSYISVSSRFCKFKSLEECVLGYFQWTDIPNYSNLKGVTDPKVYLENIKLDKYATDNDYVNKVMRVISSQNLTKYDPKNIIEEKPSKVKRVAIDAGHGSETAGKRHPDGYREHYSNTYIAFYLDQILRANKIETYKCGWNDANPKDDLDTPLTTRQTNIKNANCDISVSIHANAYGNGIVYNFANGVETFYYNNQIETEESKRLALLIQNNLIKGTTQTNRGIKTAEFAMVNCKAMNVKAAVLIETAFMTNKFESDLLKSDSFARETAKEIAQGIFEYFEINGNINIQLTSANVVKPVVSQPTTEINTILKSGDKLILNETSIYISSSASLSTGKRSGIYYAWNDEIINGRVRVTNSKMNVGVHKKVSFWIVLSDLKSKKIPLTEGMELKLNNVPIYNTSISKTGNKITGTYYVWAVKEYSGRIKITNKKQNVGVPGQVTGWINKSDIGY